MGHISSLMAWIPIFGCAYLSLQLGQRRWQKRYCSCQGNGYVCHHHSPRSTSTRAWGVHLACGHLEPHSSCCSSCCLSKSKTKNESAKEILKANNSSFRTNRLHSTKKTGHYAWPCCSFSWSDHACNHPSSCRTCYSLSPCCCIEDDRGVNHLDEDS